jgi:hypothetical protein
LRKLDLKYAEIIQGVFLPSSLNVLLTFQVNCPGCFIYSLPVAQKLYEKGFTVFGLSTAFEDFELNTAENTKLLLLNKSVVGETQKALSSLGYEKYPNTVDFPVLFDKLILPSELTLDASELPAATANYLSSLNRIPYTFTVNNFGGTPTWVIFDAEFNIEAAWFGHRPIEEVKWIIESVKKS